MLHVLPDVTFPFFWAPVTCGPSRPPLTPLTSTSRKGNSWVYLYPRFLIFFSYFSNVLIVIFKNKIESNLSSSLKTRWGWKVKCMMDRLAVCDSLSNTANSITKRKNVFFCWDDQEWREWRWVNWLQGEGFSFQIYLIYCHSEQKQVLITRLKDSKEESQKWAWTTKTATHSIWPSVISTEKNLSVTARFHPLKVIYNHTWSGGPKALKYMNKSEQQMELK